MCTLYTLTADGITYQTMAIAQFDLHFDKICTFLECDCQSIKIYNDQSPLMAMDDD